MIKTKVAPARSGLKSFGAIAISVFVIEMVSVGPAIAQADDRWDQAIRAIQKVERDGAGHVEAAAAMGDFEPGDAGTGATTAGSYGRRQSNRVELVAWCHSVRPGPWW